MSGTATTIPTSNRDMTSQRNVKHAVDPRSGGGRLLTSQEAADRLRMSHAWLRKKIAAREVPYVRLGRSVRFTEDHLRDIIQAATQTIPPTNGGRGSARTAL